MDATDPGGLGGTYAGSPIGVAAANAVLDVIEEEGLNERAEALGAQLQARVEKLRGEIPQIADNRRLGFMSAIEFNGADGEPSADFANAVRAEAMTRGLILLTCGVYGNVIRFLAPITVQDSVFRGSARHPRSLAARGGRIPNRKGKGRVMLDKTSLKSMVNDPALIREQCYVNGAWIDADNGETVAVTNPANGAEIAAVPMMGADETARAVDAAYEAQKTWAAKTAKERGAVLRKWFELMMANQDDLGAILTAEMGKPLAEAKGEVAYGASFIEWFAEEAKRIYGDVIPGHQEDKRIVVVKQPVGVVGAITPWNFPNAMITRKAGPALAVGCSIVVKPATQTPLSALAMAELAHRAGVPAGVFNVVTGKSGAIGGELTGNDKVRRSPSPAPPK